MAVKGKKTKTPPIFSHEFVIQNHADIVAVVAMVFIVGMMVEAFKPLATPFVILQHNLTSFAEDGDVVDVVYRTGPKDLLAVLFYTLIMILGHAVIQEFVLDKVNKKLYLSKVKFAKFNESGQLASFYLCSFAFGANLLYESLQTEDYLTFVNKMWSGYPEEHRAMLWSTKLYFVLQLAYWLHVFPELYLQKTKKEDMSGKVLDAVLYLVFIASGYMLNYQRVMLVLIALHYLVEGMFHLSRVMYFMEKIEIANYGFRLWNVLFVVVRLATVSLSVLTFWFGLGRVNEETSSLGSSFAVRVSSLAAVCFMQAWMTWQFINFYMRRRKETAPAAPIKKAPSTKKTKSEKKSN